MKNLKKGIWKEVAIIFTIFLFGAFFYFNEGLNSAFTGFSTINITMVDSLWGLWAIFGGILLLALVVYFYGHRKNS